MLAPTTLAGAPVFPVSAVTGRGIEALRAYLHAAAQALPAGVYIAMNGQIFDPETTRKNVEMNRFEAI